MDFEKLGLFYLGEILDQKTKERTQQPLLYKSSNLTTHAVIVGMTGSGKTGLGIGMIEEAALDRIPVLAIDPKGDLPNLALTFPELQASDFEPWVDPATAQQKGMSVTEFAEHEAATWEQGLASSGQSGDRIKTFRQTPVTVYTPGSTAGIPISIVHSLSAPDDFDAMDEELLVEKAGGTVDSILTLLGKDPSPFSQEHVLLSTIILNQWRDRVDTDLAQLISLVQRPPITQIGALDLETFYPERDRQKLALQLNTIIAAPTFQNWLIGAPLDIDSLLFDADGNPKIAVISLNHLNEREQHFFVTLLLTEFNAWTRSQAGTGSLRAMLYMDEIFGFLPPVAEPAPKKPLLSLLKQARAFGIGLTLCTQNPVDLDYKALGNAGTWFIGRLQTERDRNRLLQGLSTGGATDPQNLMTQIAGLGKREFLLHSVNADNPELFYTRWAMSYLAGPLTLDQIRALPQASEAVENFATSLPRTSPLNRTALPPVVPPEIPQAFYGTSGIYQPHLLAQAEVHYSSKTYGIEQTERISRVVPITGDSFPDSWSASEDFPLLAGDLAVTPEQNAEYGVLPPTPKATTALRQWEQAFKRWLQGDGALKIWRHPALKLTGRVNESERAFSARVDVALHELRDERRQRIENKFAARFRTLERRLLTERQAIEKQEGTQKQQQLDTYITLGTTLLSSFLTGNKPTSSSLSTAMRKVTGQATRRQNVEAAEEKLAHTEQEFAALQEQVDTEIQALTIELEDLRNQPLDSIAIRPLASSINLTFLGILWLAASD